MQQEDHAKWMCWSFSDRLWGLHLYCSHGDRGSELEADFCLIFLGLLQTYLSWTLVLKAENWCTKWWFGNTQSLLQWVWTQWEPEPVQSYCWSGVEKLCVWGGGGEDDLTFPWDCSFARLQSGLGARIKTSIGLDSVWSWERSWEELDRKLPAESDGCGSHWNWHFDVMSCHEGSWEILAERLGGGTWGVLWGFYLGWQHKGIVCFSAFYRAIP